MIYLFSDATNAKKEWQVVQNIADFTEKPLS